MKSIPWVAYPGSIRQNSYGEDIDHGYLSWDVDVKKRTHTVRFVGLPNPRPYVTVDWQGDVDQTYEAALTWPDQSRFRIRSSYMLPSSDAAQLSARLRRDKQATEVVFKTDIKETSKKFASASLGVDVRSLPAVEGMLREYYADEDVDDHTWDEMHDVLSNVHSQVVTTDEIARGTVWTLKQLEFDNLYGYGPSNRIDFENKSGIVGVFGPNAIGKSSIVGSIMYALYNASDRGAGKNAHVVNTRVKTGNARAIVSVAGSDYEVKRESEKVVSRGLLTANTSLTVKQMDGDAKDLTGEQRQDTEKSLRKLIGSCEDFVITCGSVQDDVSRFLREGPTQRKAILSRFLGIDVFEKIYAALNSDLSEVKSKLKGIPTRDELQLSLERLATQQEVAKIELAEAEAGKIRLDAMRSEAYLEMQNLSAAVKVRKAVAAKNEVIERSLQTMATCVDEITKTRSSLNNLNQLITLEQDKLRDCLTWDELDNRRSLVGDAKLALQKLKADVDARNAELSRSKKIALKLVDVPCGDQFPTCVYIKDAHVEKSRLTSNEQAVESAAKSYSASLDEVTRLGESDLNGAREARKRVEAELGQLDFKLKRTEKELQALQLKHDTAKAEAEKYSTISLDESDIEARHAAATDQHGRLTSELAAVEAKAKDSSHRLGGCEAALRKTRTDLGVRVDLERQGRIRELLVNAFSRRGIPNVVLGKLLPAVNLEMDRILDGVADFNVTLRAEDDTNALEIYLNTKDNSSGIRPLELGSGMEKMMASLALRVALSNLTTLPKTDFMIIDEGFGSLDPVNAVACVSLLRSLKRFFRFVLVISHVDIIKDAVDCHIDVMTTSDGAQVNA